MKQTIIRLLLIVLFFLLIHFAFKYDLIAATMAAFVIAYILEPLIIEKT